MAVIPADKARAGLTDYTTLWTAINLYDSQDLTLGFANLDISSSYRWTVQMVDPLTGEPFFNIGTYTHGPGTTTDVFTLGPTVIPFVNSIGDWPFDFTGPYQVKDDFGQIVVQGFVAPDPDRFFAGKWKGATGNNVYVNKVVIGSATHTGACFNAVYNDINSDGWHYEKSRSCSNAVQGGTEFAIMHFNLDCATFIATPYTTESYKIYDFGGTEIADIHLDELIDYNERELVWPPGGCGVANDEVFESFVVLNINGTELPFINNQRSNSIFTLGDNPHTLTIPVGAYYVQRRTAADAFVSDGEAPFLITNGVAGSEWSIEIGSIEVGRSANMNLTFRAKTEEIWDDYHAAPLCQNDQVTWQDFTVYSFATERFDTRPVPGAAVLDDFIECIVSPLSIGTTTMTVAHAQVIYESERYDVLASGTLEDSISILIRDTKLDTENGRNLLFAIILLIGIVLISLTPLRGHPISYVIAWSAIGGVWAVAGESTAIGKLAFGISTAIAWILILRSGDSDNEISEA